MSTPRLIAEDSWALRLITNHIGYISLAIPVVILFLISKNSVHTHCPKPLRSILSLLIRIFITDAFGQSLSDLNNKSVVYSSVPAVSAKSSFNHRRLFKLVFSFFGLQISYLLWGLLQERIMTRAYENENFKNSQFLVLANRLLAMIVAYSLLKVFYPTKNTLIAGPPLYKYGIISYANCMSTWFQYESLLYISFPVQVIAKSIKTIPVMIVGKFVSGKTYPLRQYLLMLLMAVGIALFFAGYHQHSTLKMVSKKATHNTTTLSGIFLLICYLTFDAFTSNYQKRIFDHYSISFLNMMLSVNCISTVLTLASLIFSGTLIECLSFMRRHHSFIIHVCATSMCSSAGQLFIFSTIEEFGPVVFTIIMTIRQAFSILLSCIFYGHELTWYSILGINIAFIAIFIHTFIQFKRSKPINSSIV